MDAVMDAELWGVSVRDLGFALLTILGGFVLGRVLEVVLTKVKQRVPEYGVRRAIIGALDRPAGWTVRIGGIFVALNEMPLGTVEAFDLDRFVDQLFVAATIALATWLGVRVIHRLCGLWQRRANRTEGTFDDQVVPIVRKTGKVFLVVTGAVMVVQNLGYSVTSLVAGLGIGGAALAFASKDTVANFFGSLVIFIDRPFQIGDWIECGDVEGTVEEVGVRVTLIRTFANSIITIPNAQFTTTPINNWSRMKKRRIKLKLGLTYDTTPAKMAQAVESIREIIRNDDRLHQDFFLVNFYDFGAYSLDIFCYLFTRTTNWAEHMQVREDFMLKVMEAIHALGLSFAFPTQTLHVDSMPKPAAAANQPPQPPGAPKAMLRETPL